ncbi:MAG: glycosyltransferase, partial [Armatimonadota bacterium]|nr:glycosyltransferase [Armatimonadota bacterium]
HEQALALQPGSTQALNARGAALKELGRFDEARQSYAQALALDAACVDALNNLGSCLLAEGRADAAMDTYAQALAHAPNHLSTRWNRALALMLRGEWEEGWREYEVRFANHKVTPHSSQKPCWNGEPLAGRTILVHAEQGFGDTLNFARFVPLVKAQGGRVLFECQPALHPLMVSSDGFDALLAPGDPAANECDVQIPLLSLPGLFGTRPDGVPGTMPSVAAPADRAALWQTRIDEICQSLPGASEALKVGIVWAGSPTHKNDHNRSCALDAFAPLAQIPGVTLFSLQKGPAASQAQNAPAGMTLIDLGPALHDFADTAAVMEALDLVIAVDTSVVHLAGALDKAVWTLLPFSPDWRWMLSGDTTPWYPCMRLFRQPAPGQWVPVFAQVAAQLAQLAGQSEPTPDVVWWQNAVAQSSRDPALWNGLAQCCLELGETEAAQEAFAQAQRLQGGPLVSIIVPCYKQAHLLTETMESVLAQTYAHWEVIIVNDGSPDDTQTVAERFIAAHPDRQIRLITKPNGGLPAARNTGIAEVRGEFILPLDADDTLRPTFLEKTVAALQADPAADYAFTFLQFFGTRHDIWQCGPFTPEELQTANRVPYCALMRRPMVEALGGYGEGIAAYEDWDFWLRATALGHRGTRVPEPLFCYRQSAASKLLADNRKREFFLAQQIQRHADVYGPARVALAQESLRRVQDTPAHETRPAITAIVCTFNRVDMLQRVLKSYEAQTLPRWAYEVVVVDDGSSDGTTAFLESYRPDYTLVVHRMPQNSGLSAARNAGIIKARGEIVLFQDDDDAATPTYLKQHLRTHQAHPGAHVAAFGRIDPSPEIADSVAFQVLNGASGLLNYFDDFRDGQLLDFRFFWGGLVSLKAAFLKENGLFDEETRWGMDDAELAWRLKDAGLQVVHNKNAVLHALRSLTLEQFCRRQSNQGRAAAWMTRKHPHPTVPFWVGVANADQRLPQLTEAWERAQGVIETMDTLERAGWAAVSKMPEFRTKTLPALQSLCRIGAEYHLLSGYQERLTELHAQDEARPVSVPEHALVSVVVTCYNYGRFLTEAVESIVAQTYTNWEVIIVNDGSPDDTQAVAERFIASHPDHPIRLINQSNSGHAAYARNRGLSEARGQYLLCLDADDVLAPTFLSECVALLERAPALSIAYTDQERFYDDGRIERFHAGDYSTRDLTEYLPFGACSLFTRQTWLNAGPYKPVGYEDWDFWLACAETGHFGRRIPKPLFHYRKHNEGKYAQDLQDGLLHKARLALAHPTLFDDEKRRWAASFVAEADQQSVLRAEALFADGNSAGAKRLLLSLARNTPSNARVLNNLGVLCWHEGDSVSALRWFQQALEADPHDEATLHNCADVLAAMGQGDEARQFLASRCVPVLLAA